MRMLLKIIIIGLMALAATFLLSRRLAAETRISSYQGWPGCVTLSNGLVRAVLVPQVGRVLHFSLKGMPNVLWENAEAWGKLQSADSDATGNYVNFGGAKLWVAPQSKWGALWTVWPPHYALDSGPCRTAIAKDGSVLLEGLPSATARVRMDRRASLRGNSAQFVYTMSNVSDTPVEWGIWMVANVKPGGRTFIPFVDAPGLWSGEKDRKIPDSLNWKRLGGVLCMDFKEGKEGSKIFSLSPEGWMAYVVEGQAFFITYAPDPGAVQPEGEAPTEIFRGKEFVELEHVGPLARLAPGEKTVLTERWHLLRLPAGLDDPEALAGWISRTARKLAPRTR
jgi:hypothetical protein